MNGTSFFFNVYALLLLNVVFTTYYVTGFRRPKYLTLSYGSMTCTRNMACKYAVCAWERRVTINQNTCIFLDNSCKCPPDEMCALSDHVTPGSWMLTFQYRCRHPNAIFKI